MSGSTSARAMRQFRMSPGATMSKSFRRRPELPALSVTVTTAVMFFVKVFSPWRRAAMPVPPPKATTRTPPARSPESGGQVPSRAGKPLGSMGTAPTSLSSSKVVIDFLEDFLQVLQGLVLRQEPQGLLIQVEPCYPLHGVQMLNRLFLGRHNQQNHMHEHAIHRIEWNPIHASGEDSKDVFQKRAILGMRNRQPLPDGGCSLAFTLLDRLLRLFGSLLLQPALLHEVLKHFLDDGFLVPRLQIRNPNGTREKID